MTSSFVRAVEAYKNTFLQCVLYYHKMTQPRTALSKFFGKLDHFSMISIIAAHFLPTPPLFILPMPFSGSYSIGPPLSHAENHKPQPCPLFMNKFYPYARINQKKKQQLKSLWTDHYNNSSCW